MERKEFRISINAPREKVWKVLWNDNTYRQWSSVFSEGSYAKTENWKKGSRVLFLGPNETGMVSEIAENIPNELMSFRHLGMVKNGVEDPDSKEGREWAGAMENYTLHENGGKTLLTVEMDIKGEHVDFFTAAWPKALEKIKTLAEQE